MLDPNRRDCSTNVLSRPGAIASFRSEYRDEMCHIFAQRRAMASSAIAVLGLWFETVTEIVVNAAQVHWDILRQDLV